LENNYRIYILVIEYFIFYHFIIDNTFVVHLVDNHSVITGRTTTGSSSRTGEDGVFYLSNDPKTGGDIIPLSKILGENFEEIPVCHLLDVYYNLLNLIVILYILLL